MVKDEIVHTLISNNIATRNEIVGCSEEEFFFF